MELHLFNLIKHSKMKNSTTLNIRLIVFLIFLSLLSCDKEEEQDGNEVEVMIEEVRAVTRAYESHEAALEAGWNTDLSGCVVHPEEGGMGHHFARLDFLDGRVNHLEPQVLLYAGDGSGNMEFLGVEYIVPFEILPEDSEPPMLFGQHFHKNHELQLWALHVWTEKENPKGIFSDWNPEVNCN